MSKENKVRGKSIMRRLKDEIEPFLQKYPSSKTRELYRKWIVAYIKFCREKYDCKSKEECAMHIQDYSDYLQEMGYKPTTVHNYLAAVCTFFRCLCNI